MSMRSVTPTWCRSPIGTIAKPSTRGFRPRATAGLVTSESFAGLGTFIEVLSPSVNDYETLFSSLGRPEGVATLADNLSGEIMEHAYWGGMRDRIPNSQTSEMAPAGSPSLVRDGDRVRVKPHDNICLIRSGQDWSDTEAAERKMYLDDVEPVLREGMDFLRDEGLSIGCFANRYMTVVDRDGRQPKNPTA